MPWIPLVVEPSKNQHISSESQQLPYPARHDAMQTSMLARISGVVHVLGCIAGGRFEKKKSKHISRDKCKFSTTVDMPSNASESSPDIVAMQSRAVGNFSSEGKVEKERNFSSDGGGELIDIKKSIYTVARTQGIEVLAFLFHVSCQNLKQSFC